MKHTLYSNSHFEIFIFIVFYKFTIILHLRNFVYYKYLITLFRAILENALQLFWRRNFYE